MNISLRWRTLCPRTILVRGHKIVLFSFRQVIDFHHLTETLSLVGDTILSVGATQTCPDPFGRRNVVPEMRNAVLRGLVGLDKEMSRHCRASTFARKDNFVSWLGTTLCPRTTFPPPCPLKYCYTSDNCYYQYQKYHAVKCPGCPPQFAFFPRLAAVDFSLRFFQLAAKLASSARKSSAKCEA